MKKIEKRTNPYFFNDNIEGNENLHLERVYATVRRVYMNDYVLAIDSVT